MNLDELRRYKPQIEAIAFKHGITNIRVFGSVVRGESRPDSDVDLLVHYTRRLPWAGVGVRREIAQIIGCPVDMANDECLKQQLAPYILREAVPL
ncbi:MAG: nucleotidyltransferase domain-containing protein [Alphaproteobacteria bacterium]|nr:nucleotidyltransferase domain-containing protein [Alphaproteobacteria bacterium]